MSQFRQTRSPVWTCVRAACATTSGVRSRSIPRPSSSDPGAAGQYLRLSGRSSYFSGTAALDISAMFNRDMADDVQEDEVAREQDV